MKLGQARVTVDEEGTVAAAGSAAMVSTKRATKIPPLTMDVTRPFLFFIRDAASGSVLFAGRVEDPSSAE